MSKAPEIENIINSLSPSKLTRVESIKTHVCSWCGKPAEKFRDEISKKEYLISGFCQECQDKVFD